MSNKLVILPYRIPTCKVFCRYETDYGWFASTMTSAGGRSRICTYALPWAKPKRPRFGDSFELVRRRRSFFYGQNKPSPNLERGWRGRLWLYQYESF